MGFCFVFCFLTNLMGILITNNVIVANYISKSGILVPGNLYAPPPFHPNVPCKQLCF